MCAFDLADDLARCAPETEVAEAAAAAVAAGGAGGGTTGSEARGAAGGGVRDGSSSAEGGGSGLRTASAASGRGGGAGSGDGEGGDGEGELASNVAALQRQLVEVRAELAGLAQVGRPLDLAWLTGLLWRRHLPSPRCAHSHMTHLNSVRGSKGDLLKKCIFFEKHLVA